MRNLIYNGILAIGLILAGCTSFEQYASESYGAGPSIAVTATAVTDSTFTLTVTPGSGTVYYSYVVQQADAPVEVVAASLLKGVTYKGILSGVINTTDYPTFTSNMRSKAGAPLCLPNKVYQIYAVAANKEGIVGEVTKISVTTTDSKSPGATAFTGTASTKSAAVTFSENVVRSTGKVTATYYKEYDVANPTIVELTSANISISGKVVTVMAPDAPAGAFVNFNWEAGAFKDVFGNPCNAYTTKGFSATTGAQVGIRFRAETIPFDIALTNFVSPAVGSAFVDWTTFDGVIEFSDNIYRVNANIKTGDFKVIYSSAAKTSSINYLSSDWAVSGKKITYKLKEAPAFGDNIDVSIAAGVIFDVYGNPNKVYTSTKTKWSRYEALGTYSFTYTSAYDATPVTYSADDFVIVKDPSVTNGVILIDFYNKGSKVKGVYDVAKHTMSIGHLSQLGTALDGGTLYGLATYDRLGATGAKGDIIFTISADQKTITCANQLAVVATSTDYATLVGYWDKLNDVTLTKLGTGSAVKGVQKSQKKSINSIVKVSIAK